MSIHAIRRRCIVCSSPILGIAKSAAPDVCFICSLSDEERKNLAAMEEIATASAEPPHPPRRRRPALRSV